MYKFKAVVSKVNVELPNTMTGRLRYAPRRSFRLCAPDLELRALQKYFERRLKCIKLVNICSVCVWFAERVYLHNAWPVRYGCLNEKKMKALVTVSTAAKYVEVLCNLSSLQAALLWFVFSSQKPNYRLPTNAYEATCIVVLSYFLRAMDNGLDILDFSPRPK